MAPPKSVRSISQQAFDELVKENIEDLGMDSTEALEDAIQTLTLQGVDLSGIVTSILGSGEENPVIQSLEKLKELDRDWKQGGGDETDVKEIIEWLDKLNDACNVDGSGNAAIATKNGAIELVCSICGKLGSEGLVSALKTLVSLLHGKVVENLDKLRRKFLWQGNKDGKGYSLVNWETALLSKDRGGLGIKNLKLQNESLLKKWLWKYTEERNSLWKEVIIAKYGELNPWCTEITTEPYGVGAWRSIRNLWSQMETNLYIKVGSGTKTKFWKDVWIDQSPLRDLFPGLFQICGNPDANVGDCWTEQGWDLVFRRLLNDWEVERVAEILGMLGGVTINANATDRMLWKHSKDGLFSVNSAYRRGLQHLKSELDNARTYIRRVEELARVPSRAIKVLKKLYLQSTEIFRETNGPKMVMNILNNRKENLSILNSGFAVVSAAATGNEVLKEAFMNLKIDELILQCLREFSRGSIPCLYDAVRVLLTSDDNRVVASEVYGYARRFAKIGIVEALVDSLHDGIKAPSLVSASVALKAIAVNDDICRAVAENGGIDAILRCIDDSSEQGEKVVAITCCSLLSKSKTSDLEQLAGSDINKSAIVDKDGMDKLMKLATRFSDDPAVLHEVMSMITVLSLRSPHNAACAIEAGAGDIVIQAMQRTILLGNGIEKLIRKAKMNYKSCKNAATDALRDLGLDNYNL
ncbi:hypothetical protein MTR67_048728 [Solanum verrucosum]|uniref:Uncharacterized protein n=1 Tax=Solanum verrucosum TaxID=315347 RepID=A0AAF0UYJ4_SOLVR|nr:hypothetical protein MTR67_048728 [Solanum verrucosum]